MLAHARCCPPPALAFCAMSESAAIPAHGDQHGPHIMPCSRRAPPPRGPALHGAASFEAPALSGVCLSACSASQQPAAREGSHSVCPVPCISAPLPPVSGSHCCGPLVLLPAVFMQASACEHLSAASEPHTARAASCSALRASVGTVAATPSSDPSRLLCAPLWRWSSTFGRLVPCAPLLQTQGPSHACSRPSRAR